MNDKIFMPGGQVPSAAVEEAGPGVGVASEVAVAAGAASVFVGSSFLGSSVLVGALSFLKSFLMVVLSLSIASGAVRARSVSKIQMCKRTSTYERLALIWSRVGVGEAI